MSAFDRSVIADEASVGGLRLRRFSAFHALALLAVDSPYITRHRDPHEGDTTFALVVCGLCRADGLAKAERAVGSMRWRWWWLRRDHEQISDQLLEHIASSLEHPEIWETEATAAGKKTGAPWPFYLVSTVAQYLHGIRYDDLWDMPIAELICHKAILSEDAGAYKLAYNDTKLIERKRAERKAAA